MKLWTFSEAKEKLEADLDLQDETFISANELIGYFNEGMEEAASEILKIDEDYFLTSKPVPLVQGTSAYAYPSNMYAYKVRGVVYSNGALIYDVLRYRRKDKFNNMAFDSMYNNSTRDYMWFHKNDAPGEATFNIIPASRETAVVPPLANTFTPMTLWYIRDVNRIPLVGEWVSEWDVLDSSAAVDAGADTIAVAGEYGTGDAVKLTTSGTMPGGLTASTTYYVIAGSGTIQLATTLQNARAGTEINITSTGSGILSIAIQATESIVNATVIDIPEWTKFVIQWAKCRCLLKESDPRLSEESGLLQQQRDQMVSTLTNAQQDDQDTVSPDFSPYTEMS